MKKLLILLIMGMFMLTFVSAGEWDNVKNFNNSAGKYGKYEITNWLGLGRRIIDLELINNSQTCSTDCESIKQVKVYGRDTIIDDIRFLKNTSNGWEQRDIRSYSMYYLDSGKWEEFELRDKFNPGTYQIKLVGEKNPSWTVDWQIKTNGFWTDEWAVWGVNRSVNESHGVTLGSQGPGDDQLGGKITVDVRPITILNVTVHSLSTPTKAILRHNNGTIIQNTTTKTGDTFTFPTLTTLDANTSYRVEFDADGASFTSRWGGVSNISGTFINWTTGSVRGGDSGNFYNIISMWINVSGGAVVLNSPEDNNVTISTDVEFNATATILSGATLVNRSLHVWYSNGTLLGVNSTTGLSGTTETEVDRIGGLTNNDVYLWNKEYCDSDGDCGFSDLNRTLTIDDESPIIDVEFPTGTINLGVVGNEETLNVTMNDTTLDTCWFDYNGTNITIDGCITGVKNSTNFTLEEGNTNMTIYANDSLGKENSTFISWAYKVLEINTIFNSTLLVTDEGIYNLLFSSNGSSVSSPKLVFNGADNSASLTNNGDGTFNISATRTALDSDLAASSFHFEIDIDATVVSTREIDQTISPITLSSCGEGNESSYIHIIFKDETDLTDLNASVSSSIWDFWITDPDTSQQFLFTNTTENPSYDFCFDPSDRTFTLDIEFPFASTGYPQRVFRADDIILTNDTTNRTLYLLGDAEGFFTRYAAINSLTGSAIQGVEVTVQKNINGTPTTVAQGITDDTGLLTLWLDPDDLHSYTFIKEGFSLSSFSIRPSSPDTYQIAMIPTDAGSEVGNGTDVGTGLFYEILPAEITLSSNTIQVFSFNVSRVDAVDNFTMLLTGNGTTIFSDINIGNGILSTSFNVSSNQSIFGTFTIFLNNETVQLFKTWTITEITQGDFSLDAWMEFGNALVFDSLWWNLFRYLVILSTLLILAWGFYYVDPFDSSIPSLSASIIIVWLFGTFGWLTINTPLGDSIDNTIIPAIYSMAMVGFMIWRYKSQ